MTTTSSSRIQKGKVTEPVSMARERIDILPVTSTDLAAFDAFFSAKGCPGFCWCTAHRFKDAHEISRGQKRKRMLKQIENGVPVGVLAYLSGDAVGWCSVAPRLTYERLARSRVMPTVDEGAWTILCLFVRREYRGDGLTQALLEGALRYVRENEGREIEAYPWDTAGLSGTGPASHWGHSKMFVKAGFRQDGDSRRWVRRVRPTRSP